MFSQKLEGNFDYLSKLPSQWDGDKETVKVDKNLLTRTREVLKEILQKNYFPEPQIGAVQDGTIDFSWRSVKDVNPVFCNFGRKKFTIYALGKEGNKVLNMEPNELEKDFINRIVNLLRSVLPIARKS